MTVHKIKAKTNKFLKNKFVLLCHGRNHSKRKPYFNDAITIDKNELVNPHYIHNLHTGLPPQLEPESSLLVQSVYWPQCHLKYTCIVTNKINSDGTSANDFTIGINEKLFRDVYNVLAKGGFFIFHHFDFHGDNTYRTRQTTRLLKQNGKYVTRLDVIDYLENLGFQLSSFKEVNKSLKINVFTQHRKSEHIMLVFKKY